MNNLTNTLISYIKELKKITISEIIQLIVIGFILSFSLSVVGIGISLEGTKSAFGESSILKFIIYSLPLCILWLKTKRFFNKYKTTNENLAYSILVFLFIVILTSAIIKIPIRKPIYWLQQNYIAYTQVKIGSEEMVVAKGKGIYTDDEVTEGPTYHILSQGVFLYTDNEFIPETDESSNVHVERHGCIFWQTAVLMGYNPEGNLEQQINFVNFPIFDFKDFISSLFELVPAFYLEMFLKTFLSYSLPLIVIMCFIVFIVLKNKAYSKKEFAKNNS